MLWIHQTQIRFIAPQATKYSKITRLGRGPPLRSDVLDSAIEKKAVSILLGDIVPTGRWLAPVQRGDWDAEVPLRRLCNVENCVRIKFIVIPLDDYPGARC